MCIWLVIHVSKLCSLSEIMSSYFFQMKNNFDNITGLPHANYCYCLILLNRSNAIFNLFYFISTLTNHLTCEISLDCYGRQPLLGGMGFLWIIWQGLWLILTHYKYFLSYSKPSETYQILWDKPTTNSSVEALWKYLLINV